MSKATKIRKLLTQTINSLNHFKHIHAHLIRFNLHTDSNLLNLALKHTFTSQNLPYARRLFNQIQNPNLFIYNTVIHGLVANGCCIEAIQVYNFMMIESGFLPNNFTFPFVLKACGRVSDYNLGVKIHNLLVKAGFDCDVFVNTSLVSLYAKLGRLNYARQVFDDIPDKNVVSWAVFVGGYVEAGKFREAVDLFKSMLCVDLKPDSYMLVEVLSACRKSGDLASMEW